MTDIDIYFEWLCQKIKDPNDDKSYEMLLSFLHSEPFVPIMEMDKNRLYDGIDLRYRFGYEADLDPEYVREVIDTNPCSVLEMMVALSIRIEEHIMSNEDVGDRTYKWFWTMIESLGMAREYDGLFNLYFCQNALDRLMDRTYKSNGKGGLVTIPGCPEDLREVEIWYQIQMYLNYISKEEW